MSEQIRIFLITAVLGLIGGGAYDALSLVRFPLKKVRPVCIALDILFCLAFAACFLALSVLCRFPDFRFYMAAGCLVGFFLYRKSFHKFVAFLGKKVYNEIGQIIKDRKKCRTKNGLCRKRKQNGSPSPQS